jgi:Uma2 family endonuclease
MATTNCPIFNLNIVERRRADGSIVDEEVPLTLADLLAPLEGDKVSETLDHEDWRLYLADVFKRQVAADPTVVVLADVRVEWGPADMPAYTPDVAVMRGVRARQNWGTFDLVAERAEPVLVVEITSPATARNDRVTKRLAYGQVGVGCYVLIDTVGRRRRAAPELTVYGPGGIETLRPDARGWVWLAVVGVWIGIADGRPRCYDPAGQPIPDYVEQASRIAALEAELRRLRGESST